MQAKYNLNLFIFQQYLKQRETNVHKYSQENRQLVETTMTTQPATPPAG